MLMLDAHPEGAATAAVEPREEAPNDIPPFDNDGHDDGDDDGGNNSGDDAGRWVTVATFSLPQQAHLARLRLESEEIDCFLIDENLVATDWLLANAVGGIKVQVHEDDAAEARAILGTRAVIAADPTADFAGDEVSLPVTCPACGSVDVERTWFSRRLFFLAVLIGLPFPVPMRISRCARCHHEWKQKARGFPVNQTRERADKDGDDD